MTNPAHQQFTDPARSRSHSRPSLLARTDAALAPWQWWLAFAFLAVAVVDQALANTRSGIDFAVFVRAARRIVAGEDLYQLADGHYAFKYLPPAALAFVPLALLPERVAWAAWNLLSAIALVRLMRFSAEARRPAPGVLGHLLVLLLMMPFYAHLFFLGQCDAVLLGLAVESERRAERQPGLSGALLAAAMLAKPPFALVGLLALARRQGRRLWVAAATGLGLLALPVLRYGVAGELEQLRAWRALLASSTPGLLCDPQNQSVFAVACTYLATPAEAARSAASAAVLGLAATAAVAAAGWAIARTDKALGAFVAFAGALWLVAFLSPLGWRTNLLGMIPLFYLALALARRGATRALRWSAGVVLAAQLAVGELAPRLLPKAIAGRLLEHRHFALAAAALALVILAATTRDVALQARGTAPRS
jgi:alpha-1,2-mannosyltransferase